MLTSMSVLSLNGGHAKVGESEFAATKPERALDRPARVIYTISFSSLFAVKISKTFNGCLCADAACCSQEIPYSSNLSVIYFAWGSSEVEPIIIIVFIIINHGATERTENISESLCLCGLNNSFQISIIRSLTGFLLSGNENVFPVIISYS